MRTASRHSLIDFCYRLLSSILALHQLWGHCNLFLHNSGSPAKKKYMMINVHWIKGLNTLETKYAQRCSIGSCSLRGMPKCCHLPRIGQPFSSHQISLVIQCFLRPESIRTLWKAWFSQLFISACCCYLDLLGETISANMILYWMYLLSCIWSNRLVILFHRDPMLVSSSAYERVAAIAICAVAESLGCITWLVRLFCRLKVPPPVLNVRCYAL